MTSFKGACSLGKNDVLWGKLIGLVCHPTKKVNKSEELAYLSTNIESVYDLAIFTKGEGSVQFTSSLW